MAQWVRVHTGAMKLAGIHHVAIIASDYARSKRFYVEVLGLEIVAEAYRQARDSWKLDLRLADGTRVELFSFPDPPARVSRPEARGLRHLAFRVADLDQAVAHLHAHGVITEPVRVDAHRAAAQRVVQALLTIFVESSLGASRQDSDSARRFLDEQIKSYEAKLTDAEGRLKAFKLRNIELQSQSGLDSAGRAAEIGNLLSQARLELREAESARAAASRQLEMLRAQTEQSLIGSAVGIQTPELDARLYEQKRNLDTLLQRYTDEHPDVVNTRRLIAELEAQKRREIDELRRKAKAAPGGPAVEANPAVLELNRIYSAAEVQVASLRARVVEYESRANRVQEQLKVAPQLEAELAQLNRDYQINQKNYADLVSRRESAMMSGQLENTSSVAEFRVIDPPRVSPKPVAPNRVLLMPMTLLAALGAGLGMAFLMSQIRPVFFDGAALRQLTQLPLLGVVDLIPSNAFRQRESRSFKRFIAALLALVLLYAGGMLALSYFSGLLG